MMKTLIILVKVYKIYIYRAKPCWNTEQDRIGSYVAPRINHTQFKKHY